MRGRIMRFNGGPGGDGTVREAIISVLCLASLGGLVRWLRNKNGHTWFSFLMALLTSAFVGLQVHFFMRYMGLDQNLQFALSGACGYSAGALLDVLTPLMIRWCYKRLDLEYPVPRRRTEDRRNSASN